MITFSLGAWLAGTTAAGAFLLWLRHMRTARVLLSAVTLGWALIAWLPLDQWALAPLENRFPAPPPGVHYDGILVLGGALESAMTQDRAMPSLNAAAERLTAFAAAARANPDARLVFSGGPLPNRPQGPPEAIGARQLLTDLGVPPDRVTYESKSRTTWENAVFTRDLIRPQPGEHWLMITSASHMPRAIGAFRQVGWSLDALPVGYKSFAHADLRAFRGLAERLSLIDLAAHEWIGLAYYRLRGRSSALFPNPFSTGPSNISPAPQR